LDLIRVRKKIVDEAVIKYYRNLINTGFKHFGSTENPSIYLDNTMDNRLPLCGRISEFMHLFINVVDGRIDEIKYKCTCDPTANVAVEVLCSLVEGKTLDEASAVLEQEIFQSIGSQGEDLQKKVKGLKELLNIGISKYKGNK
jgi:NifU-like protein involved in Fe-S cluster formation